MNRPTPFITGILFALLAALGLGAITTQAKLIYADGGNALTFMLARFLISSLIFGIAIWLTGQKFKLPRESRLTTLMVGAVWSGVMIFYLLSVETISVSIAVLILYTYPILVMLIAIIKGQLKPSLPLILLFITAFTGLAFALLNGEFEIRGVGLIFAVLAGLGATYTFIAGAKVAPQTNPLVLTFWISLIGLVIIIPLVITDFSLPTSLSGLLSLAAATLFYVIAILCQFQALARLNAATAAFFLNLEPVVSILLAAIVLGEVLSTPQLVGVVMVLAAIAAMSRFKIQ